jgi:hypothetical protein
MGRRTAVSDESKTELVHVSRRTLAKLKKLLDAPTSEVAVAMAIAHVFQSHSKSDIRELFGSLSPEDWGDWDPAVGMCRTDPEYEETRRRKFGDDPYLGRDDE